MSFDPDDLDAIRDTNKQAIPKDRVRKEERTPDPNKMANPRFPMRKVEEHIGGHSIIMDSTPGHRIMERRHGSGTFEQWSEDGMQIKVIVGNVYDHMKEGYTLTVDQNGDILIKGHARVSVEGGAHIEVKGDCDLVVTGNMSHTVVGNYSLEVIGDYNVHATGEINTTSDKTHNMGANNNINVVAKTGEINSTAKANHTIKGKNIHLNP